MLDFCLLMVIVLGFVRSYEDVISPEWSDYDPNSACVSVLRKFARPSSFHKVGHFSHSLTIRDLRRYFDPQAGPVNFVPTVNRNLTIKNNLLLHAIDYDLPESRFNTDEMKTIDFVLSHMDDPNWDIKGYNALERLVHQFHMLELYHNAQASFQGFVAKPPGREICDCVMDIEHNGILEYLRDAARSLKNDWYKQRDDKPAGHRHNMEKHVPIPPLDSSANWMKWKLAPKSGYSLPDEDYNNALFMYCAMEKAHSSIA